MCRRYTYTTRMRCALHPPGLELTTTLQAIDAIVRSYQYVCWLCTAAATSDSRACSECRSQLPALVATHNRTQPTADGHRTMSSPFKAFHKRNMFPKDVTDLLRAWLKAHVKVSRHGFPQERLPPLQTECAYHGQSRTCGWQSFVLTMQNT